MVESVVPASGDSKEGSEIDLPGFVSPRPIDHGGKSPPYHPAYICQFADDFEAYCQTHLVPEGTLVQTVEGQVFEIEWDNGRYHESSFRLQPKASQRTFAVKAVYAVMIPRKTYGLVGPCFDRDEAAYIVGMKRAGFTPEILVEGPCELTAKDECKRVRDRLSLFLGRIKGIQDPDHKNYIKDEVRRGLISEVINLEKQRMKSLTAKTPKSTRRVPAAPALAARVRVTTDQLMSQNGSAQVKYESGYLSDALRKAPDALKATYFNLLLDWMEAEAKSIGAAMLKTGQVRFAMSCDVETNFSLLIQQVDNGVITIAEMKDRMRFEPVRLLGPSGHEITFGPQPALG
jgi:hypothetical protein